MVACGKTGENEESAQVHMHLKHSFRGVQVYGCEKLYAVEICFNTDVRKWQMRSVLEVLCGYSVLGHLHVSVA